MMNLKKKYMSYIFILLLVGFLFTPKIIYGNQTIKIGVVIDDPPSFYYENGQFKGFDYEIYMEIKKRLDYELEAELYSFKRLVEHLKNGKIDAALQFYHNKQRESFAVYSKVPIRWANQYIYVRKENLDKYPGHDIKVLYGKRVGKNRGYFINNEFIQAAGKDLFVVDEARTTAANIVKLYLGRIDCFISEYNTAIYNIKQLGMVETIVPLNQPMIARKGVFMALSRKGINIPDKEAFMEKLNRILDHLHSKGIINRIVDSYVR